MLQTPGLVTPKATHHPQGEHGGANLGEPERCGEIERKD